MDATSKVLALCSTKMDLDSLTDAVKDLQLARADDRGPSSALEVAQQQALQEGRRADRERHFHGEVWTKDPHGGRHRKYNINAGYDPLLETPDGRKRKPAVGYERPLIGATTNFVGNHMTQGAIDLVQMELQWRDPRQAAARLRRYRQFYHPPRRLPSPTAAALPQLEAAPAPGSAGHMHSKEGGGAGAGLGGQITSLPSAAAASSEHSSHALLARIAAAGERAAAADTESGADSESTPCQAAEPVLKQAAITGPKLEAQVARRPPLAEMRHALRAYRKKPGDGLLHAPLRTGRALPKAGCLWGNASASGGSQLAADPAAARACEAAAAQAERLGDHVAAEAHLSAALARIGSTANGTLTMQVGALLLRRATCRAMQGMLEGAVADCGAVLALAAPLHTGLVSGDDPAAAGLACAARLQRATALEALERWEPAMADLLAVLAADPDHKQAPAALARMRRAALADEWERQRVAAAGEVRNGACVAASVPRPCLPRFEPRGKCGAVF